MDGSEVPTHIRRDGRELTLPDEFVYLSPRIVVSRSHGMVQARPLPESPQNLKALLARFAREGRERYSECESERACRLQMMTSRLGYHPPP